ncbi:MAG: hypothetical protein K2X74_01645, partial [Acetobacteraceae bacterium]|nr:hypothetical protein [Acetobacteraceae bacterium]
ALLAGGRARVLPMPALVEQAGRLLAPARPGGAASPSPVQWMACDLESGHYNYLALKRQPRLGSSHAPVLLDPALRGGRPGLVAFATPATLGDLGPVLRAFAALHVAAGPQFFVFFFGGVEEFATALTTRADQLFFGDNFRCPAIRFLFAPFSAADVLEAVRGAGATVDCVHGGVLEGLAAGLGVPNRILLGPGGTFDADLAGSAAMRGIAWDAVLSAEVLAQRQQKANRAGERALAEVLEAMV